MKRYCRKEPVFAMQWNGNNQEEFTEFVRKLTGKATSMPHDGYLAVAYYDKEKVLCRANVPVNGWAVSEGDALMFFKDSTFKKTFEVAAESASEAVWPDVQELVDEFDKAFEDCLFKGFHGIPKEKIQDYVNKKASEDEEPKDDDKVSPEAEERLDEAYRYLLGALFGDCEKLFGKKPNKDVMDAIKEAVEMHKDPFYVPANENICRDNDRKWREGLAEKYKEWSAKHVESDTFDSVLDEMKELHAKKNKDYGSAFHKSFVEFGPMAGVVRLNDKMERVKSLVKNGKAEVKDESLLDTLKDLSCYAVMLYVELKNRDNGKL